ncbi:MAG: hypothetical protein ACI4NG_03315 [Candidatus Gallimonas sp.]
MRKESRNLSEEEQTAADEPPVTEQELLEEVVPLLDDYFVGKFILSDRAITYLMPNGQRFRLIAEEEARSDREKRASASSL